MEHDVLLRIEEVAERLRLSRSKVYAMVATGQLPGVRFGRAVRVHAADLARLLDALADPPASSGTLK